MSGRKKERERNAALIYIRAHEKLRIFLRQVECGARSISVCEAMRQRRLSASHLLPRRNRKTVHTVSSAKREIAEFVSICVSTARAIYKYGKGVVLRYMYIVIRRRIFSFLLSTLRHPRVYYRTSKTIHEREREREINASLACVSVVPTSKIPTR